MCSGSRWRCALGLASRTKLATGLFKRPARIESSILCARQLLQSIIVVVEHSLQASKVSGASRDVCSAAGHRGSSASNLATPLPLQNLFEPLSDKLIDNALTPKSGGTAHSFSRSRLRPALSHITGHQRPHFIISALARAFLPL
jgi:hypothetical protein